MRLYELVPSLLRFFNKSSKGGSIVVFVEDSVILTESVRELLREAKYERVSGSQIDSRYDPANTNTKTDGHHHFFLKGAELYAVNDSGTAHHRSNRGVKVDRSVADFLQSKGVRVPANRVLESVDLSVKAIYRKYKFQLPS